MDMTFVQAIIVGCLELQFYIMNFAYDYENVDNFSR